MVLLKAVVVICAIWSVNGLSIGDNHRLFPTYPPTPEAINKEWTPTTNEISILYKKYTFSQEKATWNTAKLQCELQGMRLANLDGPNELSLMEKYISKNNFLPKDVYSGYWTAGELDPQSSKWKWAYTGKPIDTKSFLPGEPNSFSEYCVELKFDLTYLGLNNYYCEDPRRYICEQIVNDVDLKDDDDENHYFKLTPEAKEMPEDDMNEQSPERVFSFTSTYRFPFFHRATIMDVDDQPNVALKGSSDNHYSILWSGIPEVSSERVPVMTTEVTSSLPEFDEIHNLDRSDDQVDFYKLPTYPLVPIEDSLEVDAIKPVNSAFMPEPVYAVDNLIGSDELLETSDYY